MNELEIDAISEGLLKYLSTQTENPLDAISILGITLLKIFDRATDGTLTIARFAEDFKQSLLASYTTRSDQGSGMVQ